MFCQACGATNTEEARFCNMCGARIAAPGTPGGPLAQGTHVGVGSPAASGDAPAAPAVGSGTASGPALADTVPKGASDASPPPAAGVAGPGGTLRVGLGVAGLDRPSAGGVWQDHEDGAGRSTGGTHPMPMGHMPSAGSGASMASVSLSSIGVQSSTRTWTVIVVLGAMLVGLGAIAMYLAMGGEPEEPIAEAEAVEEEPYMEIGTPVPEGFEPPDVDFVSGGVRVAGTGGGATPMGTGGAATSPAGTAMGGGGATTMATGGGGTSMAGASGGGATMASGSASGMSVGGSGSGGTSGGSSGSGGTSGGGSGSGGTSGGGSGSGGTSGGGSGSGGTSGGGSGAGTIPAGDGPEERDIELDLYSGRVRYVIQRYYATRARSCFDRATRNDPTLRGTVLVGFTIAADGQVSRADVRRNTTGNAALGACLSGQVTTWRLPAPPGGSLDLEMPFSN